MKMALIHSRISAILLCKSIAKAWMRQRLETFEDWEAFDKWHDAQPKPRLVPLYDVEHENIVGYFEFHASSKSDIDKEYGITPGMSLEEARERIAKGPQG